jgi:hypothetical protein
MKSEQKLKDARKSYCEGLKELITVANNSETLSKQQENELLESIQGALILIQTLDWALNDEELNFGEFCKKYKNDFANEFKLNNRNDNEVN